MAPGSACNERWTRTISRRGIQNNEGKAHPTFQMSRLPNSKHEVWEAWLRYFKPPSRH